MMDMNRYRRDEGRDISDVKAEIFFNIKRPHFWQKLKLKDALETKQLHLKPHDAFLQIKFYRQTKWIIETA